MNVNTLIFVATVVLAFLAGRRTAAGWRRIAPMVGLALVLGLAPLYSDNIAVLTPVFIALLLGAGWNILGGYAGYGSFGQVAFFGAGAYAMAAAVSRPPRYLGLPPPVGFGLALVVCAAFAFVVGLPVLRLRGHYFAIATLALGIATQQLAKNLDFLGGSSGINTPIVREVLGLHRDPFFYYLGFLMALASVAVTGFIARSKFGYGLQAIRENEDAARSMGVYTTRYKLAAFVVAAMITGLAGALQAYFRGAVSPEDDSVFQLRFNLIPLLIPLIGGTGTVWGPLIGAFTFLGLEHVLVSLSANSDLVQQWERVITGALIVLVVLFVPRGLLQAVGSRGPKGWQILLANLRATRV